MKTRKKLKRHLKDLMYKNRHPLEELIDFCCSQTSFTYWRDDIQQFIRATCCENTGFKGEDYGNMLFFYRRLCVHIELLYTLMHSYPDWKTSFDSPLYQLTIIGGYIALTDEDMKSEPTLKFNKLTEREVLDLHSFMYDFFAFKSPSDWQHTLDNMLDMVFSSEPFSQDNPEAFQIFEFLEKLGEAIFLAYEIRGKEYMLSHYAERFGIKKKKLVDAEP